MLTVLSTRTWGPEELLYIVRSTMDGYSTYPHAQDNLFSDAASLSETEINILRLVCETKTRKEIAAELYMSEGTVKRHISEILAKTGYDNVLRLAVHAVSNGLVCAPHEQCRKRPKERITIPLGNAIRAIEFFPLQLA